MSAWSPRSSKTRSSAPLGARSAEKRSFWRRSPGPVDPLSVAHLKRLGFSSETARNALVYARNNVALAIELAIHDAHADGVNRDCPVCSSKEEGGRLRSWFIAQSIPRRNTPTVPDTEDAGPATPGLDRWSGSAAGHGNGQPCSPATPRLQTPPFTPFMLGPLPPTPKGMGGYKPPLAGQRRMSAGPVGGSSASGSGSGSGSGSNGAGPSQQLPPGANQPPYMYNQCDHPYGRTWHTAPGPTGVTITLASPPFSSERLRDPTTPPPGPPGSLTAVDPRAGSESRISTPYEYSLYSPTMIPLNDAALGSRQASTTYLTAPSREDVGSGGRSTPSLYSSVRSTSRAGRSYEDVARYATPTPTPKGGGGAAGGDSPRVVGLFNTCEELDYQTHSRHTSNGSGCYGWYNSPSGLGGGGGGVGDARGAPMGIGRAL